MMELSVVILAGAVTEFLEDPKYVIGLPFLAIGVLGVLAVLAPVELLKVSARIEPDVQSAEEVLSDGHISPGTYVMVGLVLAVLTAIEVAFFYVNVADGALIGVLLGLSIIKFVVVALWFMHLKFDNRIYTILFGGGIVLAILLLTVLLSTLGSSLV